jgi:23S rRNA pseudouridine2605 synthase
MATKSARNKNSEPAVGERLQKVLADAGIGSRRGCEEFILEGRVEVDRKVVDELGARVDPTAVEIRVDGVVLPTPKRAYYIVNKPAGVVSTNLDPDGRARVVDLVQTDVRLFTVGRLDRSSEGLILCTNDGALAHKLTHPSYGVKKVYHVRVAGHPTIHHLRQLEEGFYFADGYAKVAGVKLRKRLGGCTELLITLDEGRNREIRRLLARIGHKVLNLTRVAFGPLKLGTMVKGEFRRLNPDEVTALRNCVKNGQVPRSSEGKPQRSRPTSSSFVGSKGRSLTSSTSGKPVSSRAKSASTSGKPVSSRAKSVSTSGKPVSSRAKSVSTSGKPVSSRAKSVSTSGKPVSSRAKSVFSKAKSASTGSRPASAGGKSAAKSGAKGKLSGGGATGSRRGAGRNQVPKGRKRR